MRRTLTLGIVLCALFAPLFSAQALDEAAVERGKTFLSKLDAYDPALAGTYWYGIYMQGKKNIGTVKIVVGPAPEGSGAAYKIDFSADMAVMGQKMTVTYETLCATDFSVVKHTGTEDEAGTIKTKAYSVTDGLWSCESGWKENACSLVTPEGSDPDAEVAVYADADRASQAFALAAGTPVSVVEKKEVPPDTMIKIRTFDGREGWVASKWTMEEVQTGKGVYRLKTALKNHQEMVCGWALCRKIELNGKYAFYGIKWPEISGEQEEDKDLDDSDIKLLEVEVPEVGEFEFRGTKVQAHQIKAVRQDDDDFTIAVTTDGKIVAFWPTEAPIHFIMGTEEEARKDIQKEEAAGADDVKAALKVYFEVLAKVKDAEALDDIMDWESIRVEMSALDPSYADISAEEAGKKIKEQFSRVPKALTEEQVTMLLDMIEVAVDGDDAKAPLPGREEDPFLFKKIGGKWKIVHFTT